MSQLAIEVAGLSKRFRRHTVHSTTTLKTTVLNWLRRGPRHPEAGTFLALRDVSFSVAQGQALGITGTNGSGKSTLLKLLAGIYRPDAGTVRCHGRVGAILELGAGFHPEFSGRENTFISGIVMGLSKREVRDRFDSIVRFAELEDVIDDPVKTYSTGMYMRLGFAIAVHAEPEILLLDEVLAVGDAGFQEKCLDKILEFRQRGRTVVLVSHDYSAIARWTDEAIWLEDGLLRDRGPSAHVVAHYLDQVIGGHADGGWVSRRVPVSDEPSHGAEEAGEDALTVHSVRLVDGQGAESSLFATGERVRVEIRYRARGPIPRPAFAVAVSTPAGTVRYATSTDVDGVAFPPLGDHGVVALVLEVLDLEAGPYQIDVASGTGGCPGEYQRGLSIFSIRAPRPADEGPEHPHHWEIEPATGLPAWAQV